MFVVHREEIEWAGRQLILETGKIARQADGAVVATYGETSVLATVVADKQPKPDIDFFPLAVHYQERVYAAGRIPGGYFKREGRPSEKETLTSRLIDRPLRPLFVNDFRNDTQVIVTVLSHDGLNDPDILSIVAASAALTLSGIPFLGPVGGARVGYKDGSFILNPTVDEIEDSLLNLVVAGTEDAVLMVESEAKELSEDIMLEAVMFGQRGFQPVIRAIVNLAERSAKEPWIVNANSVMSESIEKLPGFCSDELKLAYAIDSRVGRREAISSVWDKLNAEHDANGEGLPCKQVLKASFKELEKKLMRSAILQSGVRLDKRGAKDIRPIEVEVGVLPRAHGSALFTRGETQAIVVATLGTTEDEQFIDALEGTYKENFLLHYNFPPYSVGETGRVGFTSRREVGHGKLAWRALRALLPSRETFPYTLRIVSEITESNGSSSMATVCGASLAMMDAGIPMKRATAGIAMGLIKEADDFIVLSDILGDEDHLGDMDFKVAGTENGITALQMDIKITGIGEEIMRIALDQAREGRIHILGEMAKLLSSSRAELGEYAPRIETMNIPTNKIRDVIGPGGKVIREIVEKTGAKIDISDDGLVKIIFSDTEAGKLARDWIISIVAEPEIGKIYNGKVVKIVDFGVFVNFFGARDGLVHISQLSNMRVEKSADIVSDGQEVWVKFISLDERGRVRLTMKDIDQITGLEVS